MHRCNQTRVIARRACTNVKTKNCRLKRHFSREFNCNWRVRIFVLIPFYATVQNRCLFQRLFQRKSMHSFMLITRTIHAANKFPSERNRIDRTPRDESDAESCDLSRRSVRRRYVFVTSATDYYVEIKSKKQRRRKFESLASTSYRPLIQIRQ